MHEVAQEQVGRLIIARSEPAPGDDPYREHIDGPVEIRMQQEGPAPSMLPGPVMPLVLVLFTIVLGFAIVVRSGPGIGASTLVLSALGWLVFRRRRFDAPLGIVRIDGASLTVDRPEAREKVAVGEVVDVGVGRGRGEERTLWASFDAKGRVLLFDGLDEREAVAAEAALTEALERRRQSSSSAPTASRIPR